MKKNFAKFLLSVTMVFACLFGFTACGDNTDEFKKVSSLSVELVSSAYTLSDGTIRTTFEENKKVTLTPEDFKVTATFDDNTTEVLAVKSDKNPAGYNFESTIPNENSTSAGEYKISFGHSDLTEKTEINVKVDKATINVDALEWDADSFVYSGTKHSVSLKNLPSVVSVSYSGDVDKEDYSEGGYSTTATLTLNDTNNYEALSKTTLTHSWTITKQPVEVPKASFSECTFEEGKQHSAEISNKDLFTNRKIAVSISSTGENEYATATNAGKYKVTLNYTITAEKAYNYELDKTSESVEWEIRKAPYTVDIKLKVGEFTYNGSKQSVEIDTANSKLNTAIVSLDESNITGNTGTNADTYEVVFPLKIVNSNYYLTNDNSEERLEWKINKKPITINFSGVLDYTYGENISLTRNLLLAKLKTTENVFCGGDSWSQVNDTNLSARVGKYVSNNFVEYRPGREYGGVGTYTIEIDNVYANNYEITFNGTDMLNVNKKTLAVKANAVTLTYGDEFEWHGVSYDGFASSDDASVLKGTLGYDTTYTKTSIPGGSFTVTPKGYDETQDNYDIRYESTNVTVNKARLTVTPYAENASIVYGSSTNDLGDITFNFNGAKNGDSKDKLLVSGYTLAFGFDTGSGIDAYTQGGANGGVKTYSIIIYENAFSEYANARYEITTNSGSFTVTRKHINLEIATINITYGDTLSTLRSAIKNAESLLVLSSGSGLVNGDNLADVIDNYNGLNSDTLTFTKNGVAYAAGSQNGSVGSYDAFTEISFTSTNYELNINYADKLVVSSKEIKIAVNSSEIIYGEEAKNGGYRVMDTTQIVAGDEELFKNLNPTYSYSDYVAGESGEGKYDIIATFTGVNNYTITVEKDIMYVKSRTLTVTTSADAIAYGDDFTKGCKVQYSGHLEKDKDAINEALKNIKFSVGKMVDENLTITTIQKVGDYKVCVENSDEIEIANYTLKFNYGTLTVNAATITSSLAKWQANGVDLNATVKEGETTDKIEWDATIGCTGEDISLNLSFGYEFSTGFVFKYSIDNKNTWNTSISVKDAGTYVIYGKLEAVSIEDDSYGDNYTNPDVELVLNLTVKTSNGVEGGEYAGASGASGDTIVPTAVSGSIIQSVSYTKLNLQTGNTNDVVLSDATSGVSSCDSEDESSENNNLYEDNEIIANFNVVLAEGYTYKIFADEDLTEELNLNNLNGNDLSIFVVAYNDKNEVVDRKEYILGDVKYSFNLYYGTQGVSTDDIDSSVYYIDSENFSLTLKTNNEDILIKSSFSVKDGEGVNVINNKNDSKIAELKIARGYAKEVTYILEITYNEIKYIFKSTFVVVYCLKLSDIANTIKFGSENLSDNSVTISYDIDELNVEDLTFKRPKYTIGEKTIGEVGGFWFIKVEVEDNNEEVDESVWIEVIFE